MTRLTRYHPQFLTFFHSFDLIVFGPKSVIKMTGDTKKRDLGIQPQQLNKEDLIKREVVGLKEKRMKSSNSTTTLFNIPDVAVVPVPELRANHLARKYCLKWQAFVLKQKRNAIRAVVHCKYHQYQRTWSIWLNMMGVEIEERRKYDMAVGYGKILSSFCSLFLALITRLTYD